METGWRCPEMALRKRFFKRMIMLYSRIEAYLIGGLNPSEEILVDWDYYYHIYGKIENVLNHQTDIIYPLVI